MKRKLFKLLSIKVFLAVTFLLYIFYLCFSTIPSALIIIGSNLQKNDFQLSQLIKDINNEYQNPLEFNGFLIKNKGAYINLNGLIANLMGQQLMNDVVKLDNGHLAIPSNVINTNIVVAATKMEELYNKQTEQGKHFIFIVAPSQISKYHSQLPVGIEDQTNYNFDNLLIEFDKKNIPYIDLRELLHQEGITHSDAFFITDHHWNSRTGFWAYTKIIDYLCQNDIILPIDSLYTSLDNYNIDVYENWFLGANGKRTGKYYAGIEDFEIIYPDFHTNLSLAIPSTGYFNDGDFKDVVFEWGFIDKKDYFGVSLHAMYGLGDRAQQIYRNENAPINKKLMMIGDSFTNIPGVFLPLCFTVYDEIDLRHYEDNFELYYEEFSPDILIVMVSTPVNPITFYDYFSE